MGVVAIVLRARLEIQHPQEHLPAGCPMEV